MADKQGTFEVGRTADARSTITLNGDTATVTAGCGPTRLLAGESGRVEVRHSDGQPLCLLRGAKPIGGSKVGGQLELFDDLGKPTMTLIAQTADMRLGGNGRDGDISLLSAAGKSTIRLDAGDAVIRLGGGDGGPDGDLVIYAANLTDQSLPKGTVHLDGGAARFRLGGHGTSGRLVLFTGSPDMADDRNATIFLDSAKANCWIGGNNVNGNIMLYGAGTSGADLRSSAKANIHLDGQQGDIILRNADCAEDFDVTGRASPGDVMVLSGDGQLRCCDKPYDKSVVGVVSGAGGYKAGLVLDRRQESPGARMPVALMGKTFCNVDAAHGAVEVGDLLTTSPTPGHAMVASNASKAFGTVLGKALAPLAGGRQLIPILVTLQ
jgi:hypothetical protein